VRRWPVAISLGRPTSRHHQTAVRNTREAFYRVFHFTDIAHADRADLHPERWRHRLNDRKLAGAGAEIGITKHPRPRQHWCDLLEQLQPFPAEAELKLGKPGGVPTRPSQVVHETTGDWIPSYGEHDRYLARRLQQGSHRSVAVHQNDLRREGHQLCCVLANIVGAGSGPTSFNFQVAADFPAGLPERLQERPNPGLICRIVGGCGQ
jgi:hypothetical protein